MESSKKIANKLLPLYGQTIYRSSMKFRKQLQKNTTPGYIESFYEFLNNWIFRFFSNLKINGITYEKDTSVI